MKANSGLKKNRTKIQMVLTALVILSVVRQFFLGNYHNMFLGILTLILFMVPQFLDRKLNVTIPPGLETVILIFIFSAEILGEINAFYVKIPIWDTILHTTNGFLMAAIGFALIDLFNRSDRFSIKMSPYFVAFFAFCFSMTVGVMWEFFEFSMDWFFGMDMQKDWIVPAINSVKLNPTGANVPIHVDVQSLVVNGETWDLGGYLDIGIVDTMKDLIVNFIGAIVFSVIGILYLRNRGKGKLAASLIPQVRSKQEEELSSKDRWGPQLPKLAHFSGNILQLFSGKLRKSFQLIHKHGKCLFSLHFHHLGVEINHYPGGNGNYKKRIDCQKNRTHFSNKSNRNHIAKSGSGDHRIAIPQCISVSVNVRFRQLNHCCDSKNKHNKTNDNFICASPF